MAGELKHYEKLTPHERFVLMVEAMARHDDREADRLEQTCPRRVYRMPDAQYQDRMRHAYVIGLRYSLNTSDAVARLRMARMFLELHQHFAAGPKLLAEAAFLFGRVYSRWEAGEVDEVGLPDLEALRAEVSGGREQFFKQVRVANPRTCLRASHADPASAVFAPLDAFAASFAAAVSLNASSRARSSSHEAGPPSPR